MAIEATDATVHNWQVDIQGLNELAVDCQLISADHGFWDHEQLAHTDVRSDTVENPSIWAEKIALMHSELSEMLEALRDGDEELLGEECADVAIRLLDFVAKRGIDLEAAVVRKMAKNTTRGKRHGRKF